MLHFTDEETGLEIHKCLCFLELICNGAGIWPGEVWPWNPDTEVASVFPTSWVTSLNNPPEVRARPVTGFWQTVSRVLGCHPDYVIKDCRISPTSKLSSVGFMSECLCWGVHRAGKWGSPPIKKESPRRSLCACRVASVVPDSLWPQELQPTRLLCLWDSPGKNAEGGCRALLQGIFPGIESISLLSSALAGGFFTTSTTWEAPLKKRA